MAAFNLVKYIFYVSIVLIPATSDAQKGIADGSKYGHGEDSIRCVRSMSLSHDFVTHKDFSTALPYWRIVFDECPLASKNTFLNGVKIYKNMLDKCGPENMPAGLLDTLMLIYDRRIQYFGERDNVRGRQGVDLLLYGRQDLGNVEKAYAYLKESIDLGKQKVSEAVLASFSSSSIILFQNKKIDIGQVLNDYQTVTNHINDKLAKTPGDADLLRIKSAVDENFTTSGPSDCDTIIDFFTPQLDSHKGDIAFLQMLTTLLRNRDCTGSELFFVSSKVLHDLSPSSESALNIAILAYKKEEYGQAIDYYQQALNLTIVEDKKADYYFGMAASFSNLKNKEKAREYARRASSVRPSWGEPYIFIGQLYADSQDVCSSMRLPSSVYWAAVDMFVKAKTIDPTVNEKANSLILTYSRYFPDKEKAFFENVLEGEAFLVGCWINESTRVRFNN